MVRYRVNGETRKAGRGGEVAACEDAGGKARVDVRVDRETAWLTRRRMAQVFDTTTENGRTYQRNVFAGRDLEADATAKEFLAVRTEGQRRVRRWLKHYNLDAIISVGYRVNSRRRVRLRLRQWATCTVRRHLARGYTLNERGLREAREGLDLPVGSRPIMAMRGSRPPNCRADG